MCRPGRHGGGSSRTRALRGAGCVGGVDTRNTPEHAVLKGAAKMPATLSAANTGRVGEAL
jgi:hypothetical protein